MAIKLVSVPVLWKLPRQMQRLADAGDAEARGEVERLNAVAQSELTAALSDLDEAFSAGYQVMCHQLVEDTDGQTVVVVLWRKPRGEEERETKR